MNTVNLSDGTYEVPVVLMHKEDEKESFGNKYVAQTALLKVEDDKKTVTILLTIDMKGIEFSYYTNGSLEGNVSKGTPVSNIEVAGETYKQGFEIPVMADGDIGLQFSVPVMPMSPSARLRIDYDKAVLISAAETTTVPATQATTETTTQVTTIPTTQVPTTTQVTTTELTTVPTTQIASAYTETTVYIAETVTESTEEEKNGIPSAVFVLMFIGATVGLTLLLCSDSKEEDNNDDK